MYGTLHGCNYARRGVPHTSECRQYRFRERRKCYCKLTFLLDKSLVTTFHPSYICFDSDYLTYPKILHFHPHRLTHSSEYCSPPPISLIPSSSLPLLRTYHTLSIAGHHRHDHPDSRQYRAGSLRPRRFQSRVHRNAKENWISQALSPLFPPTNKTEKSTNGVGRELVRLEQLQRSCEYFVSSCLP